MREQPWAPVSGFGFRIESEANMEVVLSEPGVFRHIEPCIYHRPVLMAMRFGTAHRQNPEKAKAISPKTIDSF